MRGRLDDLRPLWVAGRGAAALALAVTTVGFAAGAQWPAALPVLTALVWIITELTIARGQRAPDVRSFNRRLVVSAFLLVSWAGLLAYASPAWAWLGIVAFAMVVAVQGTLLEARPLTALVAYASALYPLAVLGGEVRAHEHELSLATFGAAQHGDLLGLAIVGAGVVIPTIGALTFAVGARLRSARERVSRTAEELADAQAQLSASHDELRQWSEHLEAEVAEKTTELEERNRHLSIVSAASFALREAIEDAPALERALRLVARLLEAEAVQTHVADADLSMLVAAEPAGDPPRRVPDALLAAVAAAGTASFSGDDHRAAIAMAGSQADLGGYAVVPLTSKGHSLGALCITGRSRLDWSEAERRLLLLLGREVSATLDHLLLYRAALGRASNEALLNRVARALDGDGDHVEVIRRGLDLAAEPLRALSLSVVTAREGAVRADVLAHVRSRLTDAHQLSDDATGLDPAWRAVLHAAPGMTRDRDTPVALGPNGEAPVSPRLAAEGVAMMVAAPIRSLNAANGALVATAPQGVEWGQEQVEVLGRLAEVVARRLQAEELQQLQQRRIAELGGLADIARMMQSTVDLDRLLRGFAAALDALQPLTVLHLARLSDDGLTVKVTSLAEPGDPLARPTSASADPRHPWFAMRNTMVWSREIEDAPPFVGEDASHGVVVPLRAKGRSLGVVAAMTASPPSEEQSSLIEQAVQQLALALDSVSLYQQATQRAARIQVLGNLARIVASVVDLREAFDAFAEEVRWLLPFERAVMLRAHPAQGVVETYAIYPPEETEGTPDASPLALSPARLVLEADEPVIMGPLAAEHADLDWGAFDGASEVAAVPVHGGDAGVAVFALGHSGGYGLHELEVLEEVGQLLTVSIERAQLFERAEHGAHHDLLTGLPNFRYLQERLGELEAGIEGDGESSLVLFDMDNLKLFNDALGHAAGDRAIEIVGREIRAACRAEDFVARVGGDEFVLVMEQAGTIEAVQVADRVHAALRDTRDEIAGSPGPIRVSAGVATAPSDARNAEVLLQHADRAMYRAKYAGGGRTSAGAGAGEAPPGRSAGWRSRPNRVVQALVGAATAGASDGEREAAALAERYATAVAASRGIDAEALPPLQMLVAATAAGRVGTPQRGLDREISLLLLDGLRAEWRERSPAEASLAEELVPAAVELAWLQLREPLGAGLRADEALKRLPKLQPGLRASLLEELTRTVRSGAVERRPVRAA